MNEKIIKRSVLQIVVLSMLFFLGTMLIDYGATFKDMPVEFQSLAFGHIDSRTTYHDGILLIYTTFILLVTFQIDLIFKFIDNRGEPNAKKK